MSLSCDKNGSMLVKGKKRMVNLWNPSERNVYICGNHFVTGRYVINSESVEFS